MSVSLIVNDFLAPILRQSSPQCLATLGIEAIQFFGYLDHRSREIYVKTQKSELFSTQAIVTHSPSMLVQTIAHCCPPIPNACYQLSIRFTGQNNLMLHVSWTT